ncbi:MAG: kelch repeat-containing protein [Myxococcota bacterium]
MVRPIGLAMVLVVVGGGCSEDLKFNLIVYDSCAQFPLQNSQLSTLEVLVESPQLGQPVRQVFDFQSRRGDVDGVQPVDDAVVSVLARSGNAQVLAASSVGIVDLSGTDGRDTVQVSVVIGDVDTFISTTNSDLANQCTEQVVPRRGHTASRLPDGRVLIVGGSDTELDTVRLWTTAEIYNPRTGIFAPGPEIRNGREGHTGTVLESGDVLIAGGESGDTVGTLRAAQVYSAGSNTFGSSITMQESRAYHTATRLGDGRVLLIGGVVREVGGALRYLSTTEFYDPATGLTTPGPILPMPRAFHAAVPIGPNTVAVIGGLNTGGFVPIVEFVNPAGVISGPRLNLPRSHAMAAVIEGRDAVLVAGGFETVPTDPTRPEADGGTDSYEVIGLDTVNLAGSLPLCPTSRLGTARGHGALAPIPGGFLVSGGVIAANEATAGAERLIFTGVDDLCMAGSGPTVGLMRIGRAGHRLTPLLGGDLLVTGGYAPDGQPVAGSVQASETYIVQRP